MRFFVTFRENTSLVNKVMVFNDMQRRQVWEYMVKFYRDAFHTILTEPEMAQQLRQLYNCKNHWVKQGAICTVIEKDSIKRYPLYLDNHSVSLEPITKWFDKALPKPEQKDKNVQAGVHLEEFAEMLEAMGHVDYAEKIHELANRYKTGELSINLNQEQKVLYLDALADQVVTATANAYVQGFDWDNALSEVNASNYSKFENGKPVFNENGKIAKGRDYFKPELEKFV